MCDVSPTISQYPKKQRTEIIETICGCPWQYSCRTKDNGGQKHGRIDRRICSVLIVMVCRSKNAHYHAYSTGETKVSSLKSV